MGIMLLRDKGRIKLFIFISDNINIYVILSLYFGIIFYTNWELNTLVIQLLYHLSICFFNPLRIFFLWIQKANMTPAKTFVIIILYINQTLFAIPKLFCERNIWISPQWLICNDIKIVLINATNSPTTSLTYPNTNAIQYLLLW